MSELTIESLNVPSCFGDIQIDEGLLKEADELDTGGELTDSPSKAVSIFDEDDEDLAGELIVDGIELGLQIFGHEKYHITDNKRALLEGAYGKLASKYGQKAPAGLGRYKEEDAKIALEDKVRKRGNKS